MARITEQQVLAALRQVRDPDRGGDVVALGMVQGLVLRDGNVGFSLEVEPERGPRLEPLRLAAEKAVMALPGVSSVTAVLTAHRSSAAAPAAAARAAAPAAAPPSRGAALPGIASVIAVASGKGGVGKSTTAVNLALALAQRGLSVGLLDADIYGPSQPRLMGLSGRPASPDGKTIEPMVAHGVKCMSIGFMVAEDTAMIWRGPMVQSALLQMLRDVRWGELDCLVVDLPPGTGDAQLTMAQQVPLTGAVMVSTPQDVALLDVKKAIAMFRKVNVPILGLIENMSLFVCPNCGHESHIFAHGGAAAEAARQGIAFLGEVPIDLEIRTTSDAGRPLVASHPESPQAATYRAIAERVWRAVEATRGTGKQGPRIVMR